MRRVTGLGLPESRMLELKGQQLGTGRVLTWKDWVPMFARTLKSWRLSSRQEKPQVLACSLTQPVPWGGFVQQRSPRARHVWKAWTCTQGLGALWPSTAEMFVYFCDVSTVNLDVFSWMRSEGSRFTLGVWGWGCVRQKLRLCPQPFATVCMSAIRLSLCANATGVVSKVCQVDSWCRSYIGVCRGGVSVSDLCFCSYIGVCRGGVSVSDLCRRMYTGVCRGGFSVNDLWRRSFIGVCRGGVSVSDLVTDLCHAVILASRKGVK